MNFLNNLFQECNQLKKYKIKLFYIYLKKIIILFMASPFELKYRYILDT